MRVALRTPRCRVVLRSGLCHHAAPCRVGSLSSAATHQLLLGPCLTLATMGPARPVSCPAEPRCPVATSVEHPAAMTPRHRPLLRSRGQRRLWPWPLCLSSWGLATAKGLDPGWGLGGPRQVVVVQAQRLGSNSLLL